MSDIYGMVRREREMYREMKAEKERLEKLAIRLGEFIVHEGIFCQVGDCICGFQELREELDE